MCVRERERKREDLYQSNREIFIVCQRVSFERTKRVCVGKRKKKKRERESVGVLV